MDTGGGFLENVLLPITLEAAVPIWIERVRGMVGELRAERAGTCAQIVAEHGDKIMFKTKATVKHPIGTAEAFNALAEGIALLSFAPGGVEFAGRRWETK